MIVYMLNLALEVFFLSLCASPIFLIQICWPSVELPVGPPGNQRRGRYEWRLVPVPALIDIGEAKLVIPEDESKKTVIGGFVRHWGRLRPIVKSMVRGEVYVRRRVFVPEGAPSPLGDRVYSDWLYKLEPHEELNSMASIMKNLSGDAVIYDAVPEVGFDMFDAIFVFYDMSNPPVIDNQHARYIEAGGRMYVHVKSQGEIKDIFPKFVVFLLKHKGRNLKIKSSEVRTLGEHEYAYLLKKHTNTNIGLLTSDAHNLIAHNPDGKNPLMASFDYGLGKVHVNVSNVDLSVRDALKEFVV